MHCLSILAVFGEALGAFLEPKCYQKSSEILDVILEAKRGCAQIFLGLAWRNARGHWGG